MRLRNVKGSKEAIKSNDYVEHEPKNYKGSWNNYFKNNNPIHIELGMGKGQFLIAQAQQNPEINYIGIEKFSSVLIRAVEKKKNLETPLSNLCFLLFDADYINELFAENEVAQIYLNFSDPWPKARYAKRRLTSKEYFARYDKLLASEGQVTFKTDNTKLFDFSLEQVELSGWKLLNVTYDLHNSDYAEGNIMTEYEEKFSSLGNPIHRLVAYR